MSQGVRMLGMAALVASGCGIHPGARAPTGGSVPCSFWPPPRATSSGTAAPIAGPTELTFGDVARHVTEALRRGGYAELQPYPIGSRYEHGFAVTTRLERIDEDGAPAAPFERWSALHPEPSTLRWLEGARETTLPAAGHYRTMLIAFTDLPIESSSRAPAWNEETLMEGPDSPPPLPAARRAPSSYRLGFFVYEYRSTRSDTRGSFVPAAAVPAAAHVQRSGLWTMAGRSTVSP